MAPKTINLKYKCDDCGAFHIRPFSNGDGKSRCEQCAVSFYNNRPFSFIGGILKNPSKISTKSDIIGASA